MSSMELGRSIKILLALPVLFVVTGFFFPIQFNGAPMNTKTMMAVVGVGLVVLGIYKNQYGEIDRNLIKLSVLAIVVSLLSLVAITVNATPDDTYVTYVISMIVWLGAAYTAICTIRVVYGKTGVVELTNWLVAASLIQCVSALAIDMNATVHDWVARFVDHEWTESVNRLYGISAELDTAGIHFSVVLVMIGYVLSKDGDRMSYRKIGLYWVSFIAITVVGNMMARTTLVGTGIALIYMIWKSGIFSFKIRRDQRKVVSTFFVVLLICLPVVVYYYNTNDNIYKNIRFGFEGFFSLVEKGEWDVSSNNKLKSMVVWPDSLKTWLIGDGYIINPKFDPHYIGEFTKGYYMDTDIGYCRFIFYFGLPGLLVFSTFIVMAGRTCYAKMPKHKDLIFLLVILNFVVWGKVATDLFFIFALLYSLDPVGREYGNESQLIEAA